MQQMLLAALILYAQLAVGTLRAHADDKPAPSSIADDALRQELLRRTKEDQDARKALTDAMAKKADQGAPPAPDEQIAKRVQDIDRANTDWLRPIVEKRGWPGYALVGKDGASAAWLLVQHADHNRAFQKQCLELLKVAVKRGDASGKDLAYLTDRVLVAEGKKQVYGTQFHQVDGKLAPQPIEDEEKVDQRRAEVGLSSMAEYRKQLEAVYKQPASKSP